MESFEKTARFNNSAGGGSLLYLYLTKGAACCGTATPASQAAHPKIERSRRNVMKIIKKSIAAILTDSKYAS